MITYPQNILKTKQTPLRHKRKRLRYFAALRGVLHLSIIPVLVRFIALTAQWEARDLPRHPNILRT